MIRKLMSVLLTFVCAASMAQVPEVTMFYPDSRDRVMDCRTTSTVTVYFTIGSRILGATGQLVQNDEVLGEVQFKGAVTRGHYASVKMADCEAAQKLAAGLFRIDILAVTYLADGESVTYTSDTPIGTTTYNFPGEDATVVSETLFADNTMLSYYPADGTEGVLSFTFSKAIDPSHLTAYFEYGYMDIPYTTNVAWTLSEDGKTLAFDLRGKAYNSSTLAYGNTFYDNEGNPTDPPTTIALVVNNLNCTDGTRVLTKSESLDGLHSVNLEGRMHKTMHYNDISLPTPVLKQAAFYPAADPSDTHTVITPVCDMMALTATNLASLARTDIRMTAGAVTADILWSDIQIDGDVMRVALPQSIIANADFLSTIELVNYSFVSEDGLDHVIKPLNMGNVMKEVTSVAALKALETGETVILNVPGGVHVTMSNDWGYCFIEDADDGIVVVTEDYSKVLGESTLLTGKLCGMYQGYGQFMIYPAKSDYVEVPVNTSKGIVLTSLSELMEGAYDNRLVSLVANDAMPITYDGEYIYIGDMLTEGGAIAALAPWVDDLAVDGPIADITGVVYNDLNMNQRYLFLRTAADINQEIQVSTFKTIEDIKALGIGATFSVDVQDMVVTCSLADYGLSFVEDATGALMVAYDDYATSLPAGKRLTGHIEGFVADNMMNSGTTAPSAIILSKGKCNLEMEDTDVTFGSALTPDEAMQPQNFYRLVTFTDSDDCRLTSNGMGVSVDDKVTVADIIGILGDDYEFPADVVKVTGIIYPMSFGMGDPDDNGGVTTNVLIMPRSAADIVTGAADSILSPAATAASAAYNLQGMRVRPTAAGLYIVNGKKALITKN